MAAISRRSFLSKLVPICLGGSTAGAWAAQHRREFGMLGDGLGQLLTEPGEQLYHMGPPTSGIPSEAPTFEGEEAEYADFIASFGLRHIRPHEVILAHRRERNGVRNSIAPQSLWPNLPATLKIADEIRERLGVPLLTISSAYRSPSYNSACPGAASRSQHLENTALDLIYDAPPAEAFRIARKLRDEGRFKGGLGLYPGFIHVDTRGGNATW